MGARLSDLRVSKQEQKTTPFWLMTVARGGPVLKWLRPQRGDATSVMPPRVESGTRQKDTEAEHSNRLPPGRARASSRSYKEDSGLGSRGLT